MPRLVLASASERRRRILRDAGIEFRAHPVDVDESARPDESPERVVARLAEAKARRAVAEGAGPLVLGADTVAAIGATVIGKPADRADAVRILTRLSGTTHRVVTGCSLVDVETGEVETFVTSTGVTMRELTPEEIAAYVASGEADGKAGAYAIQETGDRFVTNLDGSFANVVGLPIEDLRAHLERHGVRGCTA